nr:S41 family peptidase [uncultured Undibacterium sp.]
MNKLQKLMFTAGLVFSLSLHVQATEMVINSTTKNAIIKKLNQEMQEKYVFPDVAKKVSAMLQKRQKDGDYEKITSAEEFANTLTEHLQAETHDKHLSIEFSVDEIPQNNTDTAQKQADIDKQAAEEIAMMKSFNFGVERVERLPGNVGYFELRGFGNTAIVGHAIDAAMTLLNASDALIIDLRRNGGGEPSTVALLASYFTPADTHLTDIYHRAKDTTQQFWSVSHTNAPRYDKNKKVYILTSKQTFSAAEGFTYTLQGLKRSTTIGEVSGGGAHPVDDVRLHPHFMAAIPYGRSISPITKTNWEGVGVVPEIKVEAEKALKTAHVLALNNLIAVEKDPGKRENLTSTLKKLQSTN